MKSKTAETPTIHNRKASLLYIVEERYEVGIALAGTEIKSVRAGLVQLADAWVDAAEDLQLWLVGARIDEYFFANRFNHDPVQKRRLLAHREQILKMRKAVDSKGYTLIPLKMYFKDRWVKIEVGLCRGKASHDHRQTLIAKDAKREMDRALKRGGGR